MDKLFSIVVLNWNRLEYSKKTIETLIKKTTVPHILTLVDNNSDPSSGIKDYLLSITESTSNAKKVVHVFNKKNMGVAGGRNSGIYTVESLGLAPHYLFNIDDDILVPDNYDKMIIEVCDKIPKIGITGINVEPTKYPLKNMNGVMVQHKNVGNLGGAALAIPRRVFNIVGYYGFGRGSLYGHEDSFMRRKLDVLGLLSCYISSKGVHLDTDADKKYRIEKNKAHSGGSVQLRELSRAVKELINTKNVYTPFVPEEKYHPVDEDLFTNELLK